MRKLRPLVLLVLAAVIFSAAAALAFQPVLLGKSMAFRGGGFYPYQIPYSIRLHTNQYLSRASWGSTSGSGTWTFRTLLRRGTPDSGSSVYSLFTGYLAANNFTHIRVYQDRLSLFFNNAGTTRALAETVALLRDTGWYDITVIYDDSLATASDRLRFYINGARQALNGTPTYPTQNYGSTISYATATPYVGTMAGASYYWDGHLADTILITGAAVEPSAFGEFKGNIWIPKQYGGPYGAGGFHLKYATVGTLGLDSAGLGNFTASNTPFQSRDTPTNVFSKLNPLDNFTGGSSAVSEAGRRIPTTVAGTGNITTTIPLHSGKWYFEVRVISAYSKIRITDEFGTGGELGTSPWSAAPVTVGVAVDMDRRMAWVSNSSGAWVSKDPVAGTNPDLTDLAVPSFPAFRDGWGGETMDIRFLSDPGDWTYTPPTGFNAISSTLLPEPTEYNCEKAFKSILRTGTGSGQSDTGLRFSPRLAWLKRRNVAGHPFLYDAVRGVGAYLLTSSSNLNQTPYPGEGVTVFNPDGITIGASPNLELTVSGSTYVDWLFSMLPQHGMDVVTYTGNGVQGRTVAHYLGAPPELIIVKRLDATGNWLVGSSYLADSTPWAYRLALDLTVAAAAYNDIWNSTAPTANVFSLGNNTAVNELNGQYIAFLFRSVPGLIKVGYYIGNASANGPFVACGFRPGFFLYRNASIATDWRMLDSARSVLNPAGETLYPNLSNAEAVLPTLDFVSTGVKIRADYNNTNGSGNRMLFLAIAEQPGKYANAR